MTARPLLALPALVTVAALAACAPPADRSAEAAQRLHDLFDREWQARLAEDPLAATSVGVHDYDHLLPADGVEDLERQDGLWRGFLAELDAVDREALPEAERINMDIFRAQLENRVADYEFGTYQVPFNADSGFYSGFARLGFEMPFSNAGEYENYISRLNAFPQWTAQQIANMRLGLERGWTQPKVVLTGIEKVMETHMVDDAAESVFYEPFKEFPVGVPEGERGRLREEGKRAILESVVPTYRLLRDFMVDEYMPNARDTLGASELPNGRAYYDYRIRHFTTLPLTAEEVHQIGRDEVARIRAEMDAVIAEVGFEGTFAEFLDFLRTDPRFYPETAEELLKEAAWIAKTMDGKLPALFKTLPRLPYTVEPVPADIAPKYTAGRAVGAPEGSTQPGRYWVNTYALDTRPLYNLEALSLHEAVPGHHLQMALSRELTGLPNFRRFSYLSAFGEGWGLYSEWLGLEAGFYQDPYSNFGRLTYEMWRACRLVVDTGVHAMGWTRQQVMEYLAANTALSLHEIETETDRYISWPAQAVSYKIGQLKILELRRRAERELGEHFDVRLFHDAVLSNGSIPLDVLERQIDLFIAEQKNPPARG
ncbi:MAG: DUF885 domain-containing protein [Acidobacteriota bacterium]|nr:DUF885 domain-containing protein [Acidobacteriota bacterium]MDH3525243.1 DUF885 domain-containing protein [Acidobacteriota bacterium]